ncbi:MAG: hypothetical protein L6R40_007229 [Gallowayella cf. fulva]|nr:MAG: hypothetical protein L6R40_007229 [Xanthomendoza cf. fulva]
MSGNMKNETLPSPLASSSTFSDAVGESVLPSSPILPGKSHRGKPKAQPTVTPRTFTRFFTPRSSFTRAGKLGASRKILKDITASAANRHPDLRPPPLREDSISLFEDAENRLVPARKKRRIQEHPSPDVTLEPSSPMRRLSAPACGIVQDNSTEDDSGLSDEISDSASLQEKINYQSMEVQLPRPIVRSKQRGAIAGLLSRELGRNAPITYQLPLCHGRDPQYETANFYSSPTDAHNCQNLTDATQHALPFCVASCNRNSLVAIGDEEGAIRLLETAQDSRPPFHKPYLSFRPHTNAILDLAFSPDDLLLATASGDQTSLIIDMPTQTAIHTLAGHTSSLKQVVFQPGSSSVIATSSRDGSVRVWDLRCKGSDTPAHSLRVSLDGPVASNSSQSSSRRMTYSRCVETIIGAHSCRASSALSLPKASDFTATNDVPSSSEPRSRRGDVSVTALSFLAPGRENLLITTSEADATVKLWDLRTTYSHRRSTHPIPLASTRQPQHHNRYRHYGVTSMALSGDNARLYTLCRDNTIYAYSTSHLILGHAPELSSISPDNKTATRRSRFSRSTEKEGLGPIYGFRHPAFYATSFYVRLAIRPAKDGRSELLAVGSSAFGSAVVFPTDERYMQHPSIHTARQATSTVPLTPPSSASRPFLTRTSSGRHTSENIPIYYHGTALIRGHDREVTALDWAHGGELVTVSDDFQARCWREDGDKAKALRMCGEAEGRRWGCGWADVGEGWDDE